MEDKPKRSDTKAIGGLTPVTHREFETLRADYCEVTGDHVSQEGFLVKMMRVLQYRIETVGYGEVFDAMKHYTEKKEGVAV